MPNIAYFITPHGFGHAARACAAMEAMRRQRPDVEFHIYTRVPPWFFRDSLGETGWHYHEEMTDIGLVQASPLVEDLPATVAALDAFLPFSDAWLEHLAADLSAQRCRLVVCDIAPLGIAVAQRAGLPSVVVENFTWSWIYQGYLGQEPRLARHSRWLEQLHALADAHIQTEPVCHTAASGTRTGPVGRSPRNTRETTRKALGFPSDQPLVLASFGGIPPNAQPSVAALQSRSDYGFILMGAGTEPSRHGNVLSLPHRSGFYHPDLVHACDLLVGKLGYSTVAEAWSAGIAYAYIGRPGFRESAVLAEFVEQELAGRPITEAAFLSGEWLTQLDTLTANGKPAQQRESAAPAVATELLRYLPQEARPSVARSTRSAHVPERETKQDASRQP